MLCEQQSEEAELKDLGSNKLETAPGMNDQLICSDESRGFKTFQ